jgi:hypothetical protein
MAGVVLGIAIVLVAVLWAFIMVMMLRASKAQRARTTKTDFGGRYTFFGFALGRLRDNGDPPPSRDAAKRTSGSDKGGQSAR